MVFEEACPFVFDEDLRLHAQDFGEGFSGVGILAGGDVFGRAFRDDSPAAFPAFGTEIQNPVGGFNHVQIVFHHQDGVAGIDETVQHFEQLFDVREMQPGGGFIQEINRLPGRAFAEFAGEFDALSLPAGKRGRGLAELEIIQAHIVQGLQQAMNFGHVLEMNQGFLHVHVEDFRDVLAFVANFQRLAVETPAFADFARHPDIGQKIHLQLFRAVTFAGFAPPAGDVETESPGFVAPQAGLRQMRE